MNEAGDDLGRDRTSTYGPNVIVMTNAGKPLFCRYGDIDNIAHITATIQLTLDTIRSSGESMHSIHTDSSIIAFLSIRSLTLIAIENRSDSDKDPDILPFLQFILEITHQHFVFMLSDSFQAALENSPGIDLSNTFGSLHTSLQYLLDKTLPQSNCAFFQIACGVEVYGLPYKIRDDATNVLCDICAKTRDTLIGILAVGSKLISITQGEWTNQIIGAPDVVLLLEFVKNLNSKSYAKLWFPVCLPQFDSSCFFHAYVESLDHDLNVVLILISPSCEITQFRIFAEAATELKERLGFFVKQIGTSDTPSNASTSQFIEDVLLLTFNRRTLTLASALTDPLTKYFLYADIPELEFVHFFTFRFNCTWKGSPRCYFSQHVTSEIKETTILNFCATWEMYRRSSMTLRLGSCSTDQFLMTIGDRTKDCNKVCFTPCMNLLHSAVNKSAEEVMTNPDGTVYVALCGKNFELYLTIMGDVDPYNGLNLARKIFRKLNEASQTLFLHFPKRFRSQHKTKATIQAFQSFVAFQSIILTKGEEFTDSS